MTRNTVPHKAVCSIFGWQNSKLDNASFCWAELCVSRSLLSIVLSFTGRQWPIKLISSVTASNISRQGDRPCWIGCPSCCGWGIVVGTVVALVLWVLLLPRITVLYCPLAPWKQLPCVLCPVPSLLIVGSRAPVTSSCGVNGFYGVRIRVLRAYTVASDLGISAQCHRGFLNLLNAFKIVMRLV